jgi:hypothetical protein
VAGCLLRAVEELALIQGSLWLGLGLLLLLVLRQRPVRWRRGDGDHGGSRGDAEHRSASAATAEQWSPAMRTLLGITATWTLLLLGGYALKQVWVVSRYVSPLAPPLLLALACSRENSWRNWAPLARARRRPQERPLRPLAATRRRR